MLPVATNFVAAIAGVTILLYASRHSDFEKRLREGLPGTTVRHRKRYVGVAILRHPRHCLELRCLGFAFLGASFKLTIYPQLNRLDILDEETKSYAHRCHVRRRYVGKRDVGTGADRRISGPRQRPQAR